VRILVGNDRWSCEERVVLVVGSTATLGMRSLETKPAENVPVLELDLQKDDVVRGGDPLVKIQIRGLEVAEIGLHLHNVQHHLQRLLGSMVRRLVGIRPKVVDELSIFGRRALDKDLQVHERILKARSEGLAAQRQQFHQPTIQGGGVGADQKETLKVTRQPKTVNLHSAKRPQRKKGKEKVKCRRMLPFLVLRQRLLLQCDRWTEERWKVQFH
jgi:hypothetical protein